jgi:hypothetical protein
VSLDDILVWLGKELADVAATVTSELEHERNLKGTPMRWRTTCRRRISKRYVVIKHWKTGRIGRVRSMATGTAVDRTRGRGHGGTMGGREYTGSFRGHDFQRWQK